MHTQFWWDKSTGKQELGRPFREREEHEKQLSERRSDRTKSQ
jgi:hypothetical protein